MSDPSAANHYAVLGVERGADVRAIKKVYFALVRKFPPETHAEEFKRIRAAYEVLSDPAARERYDEQEKGFREFDDDVAAALATADEAAKVGNESLVQETLRPAIEAWPDVLLLREKLAASLSRAGDHEGALKLLSELCERSPETARFHQVRGLILRGLERFDEAAAALRKAHALAPEDHGIHATLVDVLAAAQRTEEALDELDAAEARHELGSAADFGIQLRRIDVLYAAKKLDAADEELEELVKLAQAATDPELPKHVATELGAPAARLFAAKDVKRANHVLERCRRLHPSSPVLRPYLPKLTIGPEVLPAAGLKWLTEQEPGPGSAALREPRSGGVFWALVGLGGVALVCYLLLTGVSLRKGDLPTTPPEPITTTIAGAMLLAGLLAVVASLALYLRRSVRERLTSRLRGLTTLHPLYLVQSEADRVDLYSLLCLTSFDGVHHGHNGMYTHTRVRLSFDGAEVALVLKDAQLAQAWLNTLLATRTRALELLAAGYLDAEHGVDLLPPATLAAAPGQWLASRRRLQRRRWLAVSAATAVLWLAAMLSQRHRADDLAFGEAVLRDTTVAYERYLSFFPHGTHAGEAQKARDGAQERAGRWLSLWLDPRAPGGAAIREMAEVLDRAGATSLPIAMVWPDGAGTTPATLAQQAVFNHLPLDLAATLKQAGVAAAASVDRSAPPESAPAALRVSCSISPDGPAAGPALTADCVVRVLVAGVEKGSFATSTSVSARDVAGESGPEPERSLKALYTATVPRIAVTLGLGGMDEARRRGQARTGKSPYDG